jgi:hypothetical protein
MVAGEFANDEEGRRIEVLFRNWALKPGLQTGDDSILRGFAP